MEMNRRSFITALFSGVVVAAIPVAVEKISDNWYDNGVHHGVDDGPVTVYHEHEHYTAARGVHNIWYVHDEFWYLLSDTQRAPFEFASSEAAYDYVTKNKLTHYDNSDFNGVVRFPNKEGMVKIRPSPYEIHDMTTLRQDEATINKMLLNNDIVDPIQRKLILELFAASNGAVQSQIWMDVLEIKASKKSILALQYCKPFSNVIRSIYCTSSYHSHLAMLQVFAPPQFRMVARS